MGDFVLELSDGGFDVSGAIVTCLKLALSTGEGPVGSVLRASTLPVSLSRVPTRLDQAMSRRPPKSANPSNAIAPTRMAGNVKGFGCRPSTSDREHVAVREEVEIVHHNNGNPGEPSTLKCCPWATFTAVLEDALAAE